MSATGVLHYMAATRSHAIHVSSCCIREGVLNASCKKLFLLMAACSCACCGSLVKHVPAGRSALLLDA